MLIIKPYTVVLLFNKDGSKVLLQKKDRTDFAGKLNGVGGKLEADEDTIDGAFREVEEETSICREDILIFKWLGTLTLPEQCDSYNYDRYPQLWFYGGVVKDETLAHKPDTETEEINWYELKDNNPITDLELAGDGNLPYFIGIANRLLFNRK